MSSREGRPSPTDSDRRGSRPGRVDAHVGGTDPPPPSDERELLAGLWRRDPRALAEFVHRTHHPLWLMTGRITFDEHTRQDWCHDILLGILDDVWRDRFEYRGPGSFWGWFRKRAYYRLLDLERLRRRRDQRERPVGDPESEPIEAICVEHDPGEELERAAFLSALESCLDELENGMHRRALALRLFEERAYEEIATELSAPLNTVRAWIRRARLAVRACIARSLGWSEEGSSR